MFLGGSALEIQVLETLEEAVVVACVYVDDDAVIELFESSLLLIA